MATFGGSFLDMAEAMLGKYDRTSFSEVLTAPTKKTQGGERSCNANAVDRNSAKNDHSVFDDANSNTEKGKSVVIQTPPKRRRIIEKLSSKEVTQALHTAMSADERRKALDNAVMALDHNDRDRHDSEIEGGADVALVKTLILLDFKTGFRQDPKKSDLEAITREKGLALECLEYIYRGSSDAVGKSFSRVGNDLLKILITIIDNEVQSRTKSNMTSARVSPNFSDMGKIDHRLSEGKDACGERKKRSVTPPQHESSDIHDSLLRKAAKVIGHFARVGRNTRPMAKFPGFLRSILSLCNLRPYCMVPFEARLSCLWAIANLACNTENMPMMMSTPNLIESMIKISNRHPTSGDNLETMMEILRAKSIASRTILNLSWSPENKILMSANIPLVQALCKLALERNAPYKKSNTMQNILVQTRRHSLSSLRNLSAVPHKNKIALCTGKDGRLLDVLTDVVLNETDGATIDYSFSAIDNLTVPDTARYIVDRPALVLALKNVLLEDNGNSNATATNSMRCQCASATILVLERAITPDKACYENFRQLLDTTNPSNSVECSDEPSSRNATAV